jgi:phage N-6-adenine-methyltransferase
MSLADTHYGAMFSSNTDMWATPKSLFRKLDSEFHFTLDVCAIPDNAKCKDFFTPEQDGLSQFWHGVCWMNPPYGRTLNKWVQKAWEESCRGCTVVCLLPARTDTRWFHDYIWEKAELRFIKGRLYFNDGPGRAPFPSMVVVFRPQ